MSLPPSSHLRSFLTGTSFSLKSPATLGARQEGTVTSDRLCNPLLLPGALGDEKARWVVPDPPQRLEEFAQTSWL